MNNAERILSELDGALDSEIELTLYGRAAFLLGFPDPQVEFSQSLDVDAVLWLGQAEELANESNFWEALEVTNRKLEPEGLYMSHLFEENQVILTKEWRERRLPIKGSWANLRLHRLSDEDLLLSKLMRDDPQDRQDALFIIRHRGWSRIDLENLLAEAVVPDLRELRDEYREASHSLLRLIPIERSS